MKWVPALQRNREASRASCFAAAVRMVTAAAVEVKGPLREVE